MPWALQAPEVNGFCIWKCWRWETGSWWTPRGLLFLYSLSLLFLAAGIAVSMVLCCLSCLVVVCQDLGFLNTFPADYLSGGQGDDVLELLRSGVCPDSHSSSWGECCSHSAAFGGAVCGSLDVDAGELGELMKSFLGVLYKVVCTTGFIVTFFLNLHILLW